METSVQLPMGSPFDLPEQYALLRAADPLTRLDHPDGRQGWLVTDHALTRAVLADPRFSARVELTSMPVPGISAVGQPPPAQPGDFTGIDPPEHTRYRRLLTGQFTVHRMRRLTERIEQITAGLLDALAERTGPVDLVTAFAQPIPSLVICELLGVPYQQRDRFQEQAMLVTGLGDGQQDPFAALVQLQEFVLELIRAKRAEPTDDLLSGLVDSGLTEQELVNVGVLLLGAGYDTVANMLAMGVLALLRNPGQLAALRADPGKAVEELLRYLTVIPFTQRVALEDLELGGHRILAGECVTVSLTAANRDPARFADPDTLDLNREALGHTAFGHGVHQCLGQQLARVELRVALPALFTRFPGLRLAVAPDQVPPRPDPLVQGVVALPVIW